MVRPRKPTKILELSGAFKKDPKRYKGRKNEPVATGPLGDAPEYFSDEQRAAWEEIVHQAPAGMLTGLDKWALEIASVQLTLFRAGKMKPSALSCLMAVLSKLGMTPADRSKVAMPPPPKSDAVSRWAQYVR